LAPERALAVDEIAVLIIEAIDGTRTLNEISEMLAVSFAAPIEQVSKDVITMCRELWVRRMVEVCDG
jgi:pyrroloquinoline quinone biosynthesis protein D